MACAGDVPTLETMAAVTVLRTWAPDLKVRVVNVVDLFTLQPEAEHPHGLGEAEFDRLFTKDKPVVFAFHGYPSLVHTLTYNRTNHSGFHVHGFQEEGTTTTPFDMVVLNQLDRFSLALDAIKHVPRLKSMFEETQQKFTEIMEKHKLYVTEHGEDLPEVENWKWSPQ
jgi:xylulose-5-phosphate/fructose-6-phosphate phosphoketolase